MQQAVRRARPLVSGLAFGILSAAARQVDGHGQAAGCLVPCFFCVPLCGRVSSWVMSNVTQILDAIQAGEAKENCHAFELHHSVQRSAWWDCRANTASGAWADEGSQRQICSAVYKLHFTGSP
jgi:hypothetical protein